MVELCLSPSLNDLAKGYGRQRHRKEHMQDINFDELDPNEPLICEDVMPRDLRALAAQVINQAVRDLIDKRKPPDQRIAALFWLAGPELQAWSDFADVVISPCKLLPHFAEAKKKLKGAQNDRRIRR